MRSSFFLLVSCATLLLLVVSLVQAEESTKDAAPKGDMKQAVEQAAAEKVSAEKAPAKTQTPIALTVEAIQELEDRKMALDSRERQQEERAKDLEIQDKLLKEKLRKMEELSRKMAEKLEVFKKEHEGKIGKLVTVVESMKPQAAAEYVENLDPDLAVEILSRIQVPRAAKILNLVDKKKGARLTELYTGYRDSIDEPTSAPVPAGKEAQANKKM